MLKCSTRRRVVILVLSIMPLFRGCSQQSKNHQKKKAANALQRIAPSLYSMAQWVPGRRLGGKKKSKKYMQGAICTDLRELSVICRQGSCRVPLMRWVQKHREAFLSGALGPWKKRKSDEANKEAVNEGMNRESHEKARNKKGREKGIGRKKKRKIGVSGLVGLVGGC